MSAANIGEALLAKRKERRLDQGRASAEIGVSPSTYRSYERNTQRPSVNVFPLLAKFLGLDIEEFLPLYAATVIFALRPALEKELAGLGMSSTSNGDTPAFEESASDGNWEFNGASSSSEVVESYDQDDGNEVVDEDDEFDDDDEDDEDLDDEEDEDEDEDEDDDHEAVDDTSPSAPVSTGIDQGGLDGDAEVDVVEIVVEGLDDDFDDEDDEEDDDEPLTEDDWLVDEPIEAAPSQLTPSPSFEKPAKLKKKKKKKKR